MMHAVYQVLLRWPQVGRTACGLMVAQRQDDPTMRSQLTSGLDQIADDTRCIPIGRDGPPGGPSPVGRSASPSVGRLAWTSMMIWRLSGIQQAHGDHILCLRHPTATGRSGHPRRADGRRGRVNTSPRVAGARLRTRRAPGPRNNPGAPGPPRVAQLRRSCGPQAREMQATAPSQDGRACRMMDAQDKPCHPASSLGKQG